MENNKKIDYLSLKKNINYANPAQLRARVEDLEWEVGRLKRSEERLIERVHEKNHKAANQVISRKLCRIESFIFGGIGAGFVWMWLQAIKDLASWL